MIRRLKKKTSPNGRCTRGKQNENPQLRHLTVNQRTAKGPALTRTPKRRIQPHANIRLIQVQNLRTAMPLPQETDPLPQTSEAHPLTVTTGTESPAAGTEPEAAVVAMEKVPNQAVWILLPRGNQGLRREAVPNGALQRPPSWTHLEERGRRKRRAIGLREGGTRATIEAGVAHPYRADTSPLTRRSLAAVRQHTPAAAIQRASLSDPLPILLSQHYHQAAVAATVQRGTPRNAPSMPSLHTWL